MPSARRGPTWRAPAASRRSASWRPRSRTNWGSPYGDLSNAQAALNLLKQDSTFARRAREILMDIAKDDQRAGDIIRRMSALLRKRELETQPVNVNELVHETIRIVASDAAARKIQITTELADDLPVVEGDRVHLQQVVLNLLLNGMEALAEVPLHRRRLTVRAAAFNGHLQLAVVDAGHGISADLLPTMFEPFHSTKSDGMGIGLSIARGIVEAHGGSITAENGAEGGATVQIALPIVSQPESPPEEPSALPHDKPALVDGARRLDSLPGQEITERAAGQRRREQHPGRLPAVHSDRKGMLARAE